MNSQLFKIKPQSAEKLASLFGEAPPVHSGHGTTNKLDKFFTTLPTRSLHHDTITQLQTSSNTTIDSIVTIHSHDLKKSISIDLILKDHQNVVIPMTNKSTVKIFKVLGECPLDVKLSSIKRFLDIFQTTLAIKYFLGWCLNNNTIKNVLFFGHVKQFESIVFGNLIEKQGFGFGILKEYIIDTESLLQLDISKELKLKCVNLLKKNNRSCFQEILQNTMGLLNENFDKFRSSNVWNEMEKNVGLHTLIHNDKVKKSVDAFLKDSMQVWSSKHGLKKEFMECKILQFQSSL